MSQITTERVSLGAFVDRELREALAERARLEDRSVSSLIRSALTRYLADTATGARRETMLEESKAIRAGVGDFPKLETLT
jgi:Arc/MetJ-type ribon-helix-helix transcriptional regulator